MIEVMDHKTRVYLTHNGYQTRCICGWKLTDQTETTTAFGGQWWRGQSTAKAEALGHLMGLPEGPGTCNCAELIGIGTYCGAGHLVPLTADLLARRGY